MTNLVIHVLWGIGLFVAIFVMSAISSFYHQKKSKKVDPRSDIEIELDNQIDKLDIAKQRAYNNCLRYPSNSKGHKHWLDIKVALDNQIKELKAEKVTLQIAKETQPDYQLLLDEAKEILDALQKARKEVGK